jgi:hypothetical protein
MSAGAIIAGQVAIQAQVQNVHSASQNLNRLNRNMSKLEETASGLQKAMRGFKGFIAALVALNVVQRNLGKINKIIRETVDQIDNLDKGSKRLGLTVQEYRNFALAAQMAGASIEQFETAFTSMQRNIANLTLTEAGGEAKGALEKLGLDLQSLLDMDPAERLYRIAGALQEFGKHGDRAGLTMKIFGESGVKLLPMLDQGEQGLRDFVGGIQRLTGEIGPETAAKFAQMRDAIALWDAAMLTAQANLTATFTPAIIDALAALVAGIPIIEQIAEQFMILSQASGIIGSELGIIDVLLGTMAFSLMTVTNAINRWEWSILAIKKVLIQFKGVLVETDKAVSGFLSGVAEGSNKITGGTLGKGFKRQLDDAKSSSMQLEAEFNIIQNRMLELDKQLETSQMKAAKSFMKAKKGAYDFKSTITGVTEAVAEMRKQLEMELGGGNGKIAEIKKAVIDMGRAFAGEAVRMGTASSEIQMRQMANRQLEILKRIEENTSTNVVVVV